MNGQEKSENISFRLGFLGAGNIALAHAHAAETLGHRIAAGCTRSEESPRWAAFKENFPQARFAADGAELLEADDIDAVVACLSWFAMPEWLPVLLASSKPVLIEKPLGLDSEVVRNAVEQSGAHLENKMVGMNRRFYASVGRLCQRAGQGGLKSAHITISENVASLTKRYGPEIIPHILAYSSCHIIDVALHVLGKLRVNSVKACDETGSDRPFVSYNGLLETAEEVPVFLSINADSPDRIGLSCRFTDHTVWDLSPVEMLNVYDGYNTIEPTEEVNVRRYEPKAVESVVTDASMRPGIREQMAAFVSGDFGAAARPGDFAAALELSEAIQRRADGAKRSEQ